MAFRLNINCRSPSRRAATGALMTIPPHLRVRGVRICDRTRTDPAFALRPRRRRVPQEVKPFGGPLLRQATLNSAHTNLPLTGSWLTRSSACKT